MFMHDGKKILKIMKDLSGIVKVTSYINTCVYSAAKKNSSLEPQPQRIKSRA